MIGFLLAINLMVVDNILSEKYFIDITFNTFYI